MPPRKHAGPPPKHRRKGQPEGSGGRPARRPESAANRDFSATKLPNKADHPRRQEFSPPSGGQYWMFGHHAVAAALANPRRRIHQIVATAEAAAAIRRGDRTDLPAIEAAEREALDRLLGRDAVHQGLAARVSPLPDVDIYEICDLARSREKASLVVLDQVTDPHNVGAILRSAAAFGAIGVLLTERHAAPESGTLAKAASGALEHVPLVRVTNLARAMEELKEAGFWCLGLAAEGRQTLAELKPGGRIALCLGAEGSGLRRLTRDHCDALVRLPTSGPIGHLNVSNAAAISLYELVR
jgi:23S rRNA (guanosine2251-2'-O)-methyltransferase